MPSLLHTVRDLGRLREITTVLVRHGFGELVQRTDLGALVPGRAARADHPDKTSTAERVRKVLEELGPSFVKLGQIASTRPDLIPADLIAELQKLQDSVPPVPFEQMRPELERQLGAPIGEIFQQFDEVPIASASIGQVYKARLATDSGVVDVVVKAQRPNIASTIERDVDLLYWLAHALERSIPEAHLYAPVKVVDEFDRSIRAELDFAQEADNAERFADNLSDLPSIAFPAVYRQASSSKVITLSFIDGKNVFQAVADGADGERIAKTAIGAMVRMIFDHGFFHADPHPGNILITGSAAEPTIALIDLGLVGRLSPKLRDRLVDLMIAIGRENPEAIADALYAIGRPTKRIDRTAYENEVARLSEKYLRKRLGDIQVAELIRDLGKGALKYGVEVPTDFLMVGKALMTVEGIGRQIYPELNVVEELKPYLAQVLAYRYSPERLTGDLMNLATRIGSAAQSFPTGAADILEDMRQGRLSVEVRQPYVSHAGERLGRRLFAGLGMGSMVIGAAILIAAGHDYHAWVLLGATTIWGFVHNAAMALGKNTPPR